jgi:hypothetical protein
MILLWSDTHIQNQFSLLNKLSCVSDVTHVPILISCKHVRRHTQPCTEENHLISWPKSLRIHQLSHKTFGIICLSLHADSKSQPFTWNLTTMSLSPWVPALHQCYQIEGLVAQVKLLTFSVWSQTPWKYIFHHQSRTLPQMFQLILKLPWLSTFTSKVKAYHTFTQSRSKIWEKHSHNRN